MLWKEPKRLPIIWTNFVRNLSPRPYQNRPIWSHWWKIMTNTMRKQSGKIPQAEQVKIGQTKSTLIFLNNKGKVRFHNFQGKPFTQTSSLSIKHTASSAYSKVNWKKGLTHFTRRNSKNFAAYEVTLSLLSLNDVQGN